MTSTPALPLLPDASWAPDGALILHSPAAAERVRRKRMSISVATTLDQCPASLAKRLLPEKADPFGPREVGIESHEVLDEFYQLPAEHRTPVNLRSIVMRRSEIVWAPDTIARRIDKEALYADELAADAAYDTTARIQRDKTKWVETVYGAVLGVFSLEDPTKVEVEATEKKYFTTVGAGVPITVTVDRIIRLPDGQLRVDDWKFASESKLNPREDARDEYADQGRAYAHAIEEVTGEQVAEMRLIFPGMVGKATNRDSGGSYRIVPLDAEQTRDSIAFLDDAWQRLNQMVDERRFPAKPSTLCGWCPLVNSCPSAVLNGKKATANAAKLWTAEQLGIPRSDSDPAPASSPAASRVSEHSRHPRMVQTTPQPGAVNGEIMTTPDNVTPMRRPIPDAAPYVEHLDPVHPGAEPATNLASYGVQAAFSFQSMALRHLFELDAPIDEATQSALAETFAMIIADVQNEIVHTTRLQHGIHPRLRGLLVTILRATPFPIGQPLTVVDDWIIATKRAIWVGARHAVDLYDRQDTLRHSTAYRTLAATPATA